MISFRTMVSLGKAILVGLMACLFITAGAAAQSTTGSIYGTVTDNTGAAIPGAVVSAVNDQTGFSQKVVSNASGEYVFPILNPGNYTLTTVFNGFAPLTQHGLVLSANENLHSNPTLSPGDVSQVVEVSNAQEMVDTRESQLGTTIDEQRIQELPLNGRNAYTLVTLIPGVTNYNADTTTGSRAGVNFSTNGLQTNMNSYYLDGTPDTAFYQNGGDPMPNPDALQEFRVLTSNFDAEFGRAPGAVVNAITGSGTSSLHGAVYEYLRNNIFNARTAFQSQTPSLKQNQFGAHLGGPLLPNKKVLFFTSYEGLVVHTPVVISSTGITTATSYERMGDFSHDPASVTSKLTSGFITCGTAHVICPTALDPVAQALLAYVPVEQTNGNGTVSGTAQQSAPGNIQNNQGLARIDYQVNAAHTIEGLYFTSRRYHRGP